MSSELNGYLDFPHVGQVFVIHRKFERSNGKIEEETTCGVSSLSAERASAQKLLELVRGHWGIENRLHYVRDVTYDEDRSRVRRGSAPRLMASLRNLAISVFRLLDFRYISDAVRHFQNRKERAFLLLGI